MPIDTYMEELLNNFCSNYQLQSMFKNQRQRRWGKQQSNARRWATRHKNIELTQAAPMGGIASDQHWERRRGESQRQAEGLAKTETKTNREMKVPRKRNITRKMDDQWP
jgi:hypothetical protein